MPEKLQQLYDNLKSDGLYTKSYNEFVNQFSTQDKVVKLHSALQADKVYTKPIDTFKGDFFSQIDNKPKPIEDTMGLLQPKRDEQMQWKEDLNYNTIAIPDNRKVDAVTGTSLSDTNKLHSNIDKDLARHIVEKANQYGIDPYTALALAHQETGFNPDYEDNPFRVRFDVFKNEDKASNGDPIDAAMRVLKDKMQLAGKLGKKTDAEKIQGWNGYGKVGKNTEGTQNRMYGVDVSKDPIDMNKNPVYGKRVIDIRDNILKTNPNIVKLVEDANNSNPQGGQGTLNLPK